MRPSILEPFSRDDQALSSLLVQDGKGLAAASLIPSPSPSPTERELSRPLVTSRSLLLALLSRPLSSTHGPGQVGPGPFKKTHPGIN
jgi:hypothetical protein